MRRIHYFSGIIISVFIGLHLFNHVYSLFGAAAHIHLMNDLRIIYRNPIAESILLAAVGIQIFSGTNLFLAKRKVATGFFEELQVWTGLYLAIFLMIHLSAVFAGRYLLDLDTNFYFGAAGLNVFPYNLFFIPYYGLAIISFFGHIAAVYSLRMKRDIFGLEPNKQAYFILLTGTVLAIVVLYGLTNGFRGYEIPEAYDILIGR